MDMLDQKNQDDLNAVCDAGDPKEIKAAIERIREDLNPFASARKDASPFDRGSFRQLLLDTRRAEL